MANDRGFMVRWITRWDREPVTSLLAAVARQHGVEPDPDALARSFEQALRSPEQVRFCVAVRDGQVLGQASLHRAFSTWRGELCGTIEDLFVLEAERHKGVATALFNFLAMEARRRRYCRLRLDVQADNAAARAFYAHYGLSETGYQVYELPLEAAGESKEEKRPRGLA